MLINSSFQRLMRERIFSVIIILEETYVKLNIDYSIKSRKLKSLFPGLEKFIACNFHERFRVEVGKYCVRLAGWAYRHIERCDWSAFLLHVNRMQSNMHFFLLLSVRSLILCATCSNSIIQIISLESKKKIERPVQWYIIHRLVYISMCIPSNQSVYIYIRDVRAIW